MKHIAICGDQGVGKSTLLNRLIDTAAPNLPKYGFITKKTETAFGDFTYIYQSSTPENKRVSCCENCVGIRYSGCPIQRNTSVFDTIGVKYLKQVQQNGIVIMDELGFLENDALLFQNEVINILDSNIPAILTLKDKDTPFLTRIKNHNNLCLYHISSKNRDSLFTILLPYVSEMNHERRNIT